MRRLPLILVLLLLVAIPATLPGEEAAPESETAPAADTTAGADAPSSPPMSLMERVMASGAIGLFIVILTPLLLAVQFVRIVTRGGLGFPGGVIVPLVPLVIGGLGTLMGRAQVAGIAAELTLEYPEAIADGYRLAWITTEMGAVACALLLAVGILGMALKRRRRASTSGSA